MAIPMCFTSLLTIAALTAAHYTPYSGVKRFWEVASNTISHTAFPEGHFPNHGRGFVIRAQQVCWWSLCVCVCVCVCVCGSACTPEWGCALHSNTGEKEWEVKNKRERGRMGLEANRILQMLVHVLLCKWREMWHVELPSTWGDVKNRRKRATIL